MVKAIIKIDERTNRILNIVKAKYGLKDKSEAINLMAQQFEESIMEPELRPEFIESLKASEKEKTVKVKDFASRYSE
jgi:ribosomal protein L25 (general stress protein Ctc)